MAAMAATSAASLAVSTPAGFLSSSSSVLDGGQRGAGAGAGTAVIVQQQRRSRHVALRAVASPRAEFELPPPPYELDALEPHMSKNTLEFHWGKHHRAYVDNLNKQIAGTEEERYSLEEVVLKSYNNGTPTPLFNNAGQIWNHTFFWESMKPAGGGAPKGKLLQLINRDFGSFDEFKTQFKAAGATQFGSGWAWLVIKPSLEEWIAQRQTGSDEPVKDKDGNIAKSLAVVKTPNAVTPVVWGDVPLLTMDVWEHAYYLDYQNRRPAYMDVFLDQLVNWDAVEARLEAALSTVNLTQQTFTS
ncbi:hypothetical protein CBR_g17032 [Chara braunii]|uniref:superoxide dismutase n=1 Tax=Chara braunii TaxID=69332 RepID=A0A388KUF0_CHABU|nr:hypothetical protein CBR_g17032 [Chara braunii]|eukprot:GBG73690.1 hypothetical protein CBR_g17032 [Chara braunii]